MSILSHHIFEGKQPGFVDAHLPVVLDLLSRQEDSPGVGFEYRAAKNDPQAFRLYWKKTNVAINNNFKETELYEIEGR